MWRNSDCVGAHIAFLGILGKCAVHLRMGGFLGSQPSLTACFQASTPGDHSTRKEQKRSMEFGPDLLAFHHFLPTVFSDFVHNCITIVLMCGNLTVPLYLSLHGKKKPYDGVTTHRCYMHHPPTHPTSTSHPPTLPSTSKGDNSPKTETLAHSPTLPKPKKTQVLRRPPPGASKAIICQ